MSDHLFNPFTFQDWRANGFRPKVADVRTLIERFERLKQDIKRLQDAESDAVDRAEAILEGLEVGPNGLTNAQLDALIRTVQEGVERAHRVGTTFMPENWRHAVRRAMADPEQDAA